MSSRKTGLICDLNNLYFGVQGKYGPSRRVQMVEYVNYLKAAGHEIIHKVAYTRQKPKDMIGFATMLRNEGWELHCGNTSWAIAMALRAADMMPQIEAFVIGTNFDEAGRILQWAKSQGKHTKCFAANIPKFFKQVAECVEIPECILEPASAA